MKNEQFSAGEGYAYPGIPLEAVADGDPLFIQCREQATRVGLSDEATRRIFAFDPATFADLLEVNMIKDEQGKAEFAHACTTMASCLSRMSPELYPAAHEVWCETNSSSPFLLGEVASTQPSLQRLLANPRAFKKVALNVGYAGEELCTYNLTRIEELARRGLVDHLLDLGFEGLEPLFHASEENCGETPYEYLERHDRLRALACIPGFEAFLSTSAAPHVIQRLTEEVVTLGDSIDDWHQGVQEFVQLATDPTTAADMDAIARHNPGILQLLAPTPEGAGPPLDEKRRLLTELATLAPNSVDERLVDVSRLGEISPANYWRVFQAITDYNLERFVISNNLFESHFLDWVSDPSTASPEEKRRLLADPVFRHGLVGALSGPTLTRLRECMEQRDSSTDCLATLIKDGLPEKEAIITGDTAGAIEPKQAAIEIYKAFYEKYGLDCFELLDAWMETGQADDDGYSTPQQFVRGNINTMRRLMAADKRICRALYDRFFIRCFGRYRVDDLAEQYRTMDDDGPHAMALVGTSDRNWSLHQFTNRELPNIRLQLARLGVRLRVAEGMRKREVGIVLGRSLRQYGPASAGVVVAHGSGEEEGEGYALSYQQEEEIVVGDFLHIVNEFSRSSAGAVHSGLTRVLLPWAPLAYHCCGSGREPSPHITIGKASAIALGAVVLASNGAQSLEDVAIRNSALAPGLALSGRYVNEQGRWGVGSNYTGMFLREEGRRYRPWPRSPDATIKHIATVIRTMPP